MLKGLPTAATTVQMVCHQGRGIQMCTGVRLRAHTSSHIKGFDSCPWSTRGKGAGKMLHNLERNCPPSFSQANKPLIGHFELPMPVTMASLSQRCFRLRSLFSAGAALKNSRHSYFIFADKQTTTCFCNAAVACFIAAVVSDY